MNNESVCIGVCTMQQGVCIGCGRTLEEIGGWGQMDREQKQVVKEQAQERLFEVRGTITEKKSVDKKDGV